MICVSFAFEYASYLSEGSTFFRAGLMTEAGIAKEDVNTHTETHTHMETHSHTHTHTHTRGP